MRLRSLTHQRRAATLVESAVIFAVFIILILGFLDLGVGVLRYHLLAQAARQGARQTIVHGELASEFGSWGPTALGPITAADPHPLAQTVHRSLVGMDPASVTIQAEWLDGHNRPGGRVRVMITAAYRPAVTLVFNAPIHLRASSTMTIAH